MRKEGTTQHYHTVRGRGFDQKQWMAALSLAESIVQQAEEEGLKAKYEGDAYRLLVTPPEGEGTPLVIWREDGPNLPREVSARGDYDLLVQSILTAIKKVAPDIFVMTTPDGRDYRRIFAKKTPRKDKTLPEIKEIAERNRQQKNQAFQQSVRRQKWPNPDFEYGTKKQRFIEFTTLPKKEQTAIRHRWEAEYGRRYDQMAERAIKKVREAEKARNEALKEKAQAQDAAQDFKVEKDEAAKAVKDLQDTKQEAQKGDKIQPKKAGIMDEKTIYKAAIRVAATTENKKLKRALLEILRDTVPNTKAAGEEEKEGRFEEGESVDVGDWLQEHGHKEDAEKWEKHEGEIGKKSSMARVFPEVHDLAWDHVVAFSRKNKGSKVASGSTSQRVAVSDRLAKKWIQDAIKNPGRVREYLGIPEGQTIPKSKLDTAIEKVKKTDNKSLLSALLLAKRLKGMK